MPWIQLRETEQTKCFMIDLDNMGEVNSYITVLLGLVFLFFFYYGFVWTYDATWYRGKFWWLNWSEYSGAMPWKIMLNPIALYTHSFFPQCVYPDVGLFLSVISSHCLSMFSCKINYKYLFLWPFSIAMVVYLMVNHHSSPLNLIKTH